MRFLNATLLSIFSLQLSFSQTLMYADGSSQNMSNIFVNVNSVKNSTIKGSKYLNEDFINSNKINLSKEADLIIFANYLNSF